MNAIDQILVKYTFDKRLLKIAINFEGIEMLIGFPVPDDYKYFLENYKEYEGFIHNTYLKLWGWESLLENNTTYFNNGLPNVIAIGSDGSAEFIGLEFFTNECRVVLCPFIEPEPENHIVIGNSFTDMLRKLDANKDWFS